MSTGTEGIFSKIRIDLLNERYLERITEFINSDVLEDLLNGGDLVITNINERRNYWVRPPLVRLTNLTDLRLNENQIGEEDVDWLQAQLPNCYIF